MMKSHPVGQGNHNNIHYILRSTDFIFKLCAFPDINKIFIMSSSCKTDKNNLNNNILYSDMKKELLKWDLELIADSNKLFNLRFDNTKELMSSDYYKESL